MNLSVCSLKSILPFGPPKVFRGSAPAELSRPALAETASNSFGVLGQLASISSPLKLLWLKSTCAHKSDKFILNHNCRILMDGKANIELIYDCWRF